MKVEHKTNCRQIDSLTRCGTVFQADCFARYVFRLLTCLVALSSLSATANAQPVGDSSAKAVVRFDGRNVLFLGLSNEIETFPAGEFDGFHIVSLPCRGSTPDRPRYYRFAVISANALERDLLDDSVDGNWQQWDIVSAALVAEGVEDRRQVDAYRDKVAAVVRQLSPNLASLSKVEQTQAVFETMHNRLLVGKYDIGCTNLAQTIDTGDFNCVSATVLFHAMARQAGLDVRGLEMKGHALSRVRTDRRLIDLETTCAEWFRLSDRERRKPQNIADAGYDTVYSAARRNTRESIPRFPNRFPSVDNDRSTVPASQSQTIDPADLPPVLSPDEVPPNLREISDVQLIATIYYNRGVDELIAGRFREATVSNVKALQLDPHNENAWRNLMATLNNWAIARASQGDHINAAQLLDEGRLIDDGYELFRANQVHTYYHWIVDVADRRDYETALTLLRLAEDRLPNQPNLRFLNYTIRRKMANEFFESREDRKAFEQFDIAARIAPSDVDVTETEITDVTRHVRQLIDGNDLSRAIWLIDRELAREQTRHPALRLSTMNHGDANVKGSHFAVQAPDVPEISPLFSRPIILDDDLSNDTETTSGPQIVVTPRRPADNSSGVSTNDQRVPVVTAPISEKPTANSLESLLSMRADAVVAWAGESIRRRDYPEAIRRLTIGEPPRNRMNDEQIRLLRRTCDDWIAALQSENRHDEAQTLIGWAADSPYLD